MVKVEDDIERRSHFWRKWISLRGVEESAEQEETKGTEKGQGGRKLMRRWSEVEVWTIWFVDLVDER